jgi:hypothetical protein
MTAAERLLELAADPFIRDTETRASLEFHHCAHQNPSEWWALAKHTYLVHPSHPSDEELLWAAQNPVETLDVTMGEMAATTYATSIIAANANIAMFAVQGAELEEFIQECIRTYTEKAFKMLRPASEDKESHDRVAHLIDLYTTTTLAPIRMISHVQAALKNGMAWEELKLLMPSSAAVLPDDTVADKFEIPSNAQEVHSSASSSLAERAATRRSVVMPILKQKRWSRGKLVTESGVGKNCVYEYLDGKRNPGTENRQAMADALGLKLEELPE